MFLSRDFFCEGGGGYPPFSLSGDRYDQSTFWGRLQRIIDLFNPRLLFVSDDDIVNVSGYHAITKVRWMQ